MHATRSPAPVPGRTVVRVLKAGSSLLVLAAAVVGLPLLLAWVTPVVWAATHDDLIHLLDRQDTGGAFLLLLVVAGWSGWAQFAFCAVRELIAQLCGRAWRAPQGMGFSQRAAALLIGSIVVLLPAGSALASDAHAAPATAPSIPGQEVQARHDGQGAQDSASPTVHASAAGTSYTVRETRPAQSLWGIAERELGDGERWREIASLNEGRVMPDGQVFRASSFLLPGWQLAMPASDAAPATGGARTQLGSAPAASAASGHVVTVRAGDYLSKIAEEELGDGGKWPALFEASQGRPQPHGLPAISDPDVIYAGQQVTVPATRPAPQTPPHDSDTPETGPRPGTPPAAPSPGDAHKPGGGPVPVPDQSTAPAPTPPASRAPSSPPTRQPSGQQDPPSAPAAPPPSNSPASTPPTTPARPSGTAAPSPATASPAKAPSSAPAGSPLALRTVLGAGALLAAALTGALALRRTLQRRRRRPGEKIAITSQPSPAEATLAATAEPDGAARLDTALRTMAHRAARQDSTADQPKLRAARIGARTVQVLPEDRAQAPQTPFTASKGSWWALDADGDLLDEETAREVPAPCPGLVTLGSTQTGDLMLLNFAHLPAVLLDGEPVHISEVCTSIALEYAMSPWAAEVEVVTVGFGEDLPQLLPTARIAHMRHASHALRDLSERLLEAHQIPATRQQPYVLLCAAPLEPDTAWEFAELIDKAGTVPVTLVAPAVTAAAYFPQAETLNTSLSTPQYLDCVSSEITLQRLEHAAYLQIATALKVSGQPAHPAEGPWQHIPGEPDSTGEQPAPTAPAPSTAQTDTARPAPSSDSGTVFPALLAATTDPSALPVRPAPAPADDRSAPQAATTPSAPPPAVQSVNGKAAPAENHTGPAPKRDPDDIPDRHAPEIKVLGPIEVSGVERTGHGPRMAQLAALLFFKPGRGADALCSDMDPVSPWSSSTLNARIQGLRRSLGNDPDGHPYVPRRSSGEDPYRLAPGVRCDWNHFLQLVEDALPLGPAGVDALEKALTLVRGRPFGGKPLPWAEPYRQEMITRIVDVAHTVAAYRTRTGPHHDLSAARRAVTTGLDADDSAELLYRDWLRIEHAAGNRHGLHTAITRLQHINRTLDCDPEPETEHLIHTLLHPGHQP
ncbi:hypothetical protein B6E66_13910 [Streptomyces maremycinicus]|nr:hypothetical protein B6E66_13910 [Streptomyces sp. B9173]